MLEGRFEGKAKVDIYIWRIMQHKLFLFLFLKLINLIIMHDTSCQVVQTI
jgi:hypothetical protein